MIRSVARNEVLLQPVFIEEVFDNFEACFQIKVLKIDLFSKLMLFCSYSASPVGSAVAPTTALTQRSSCDPLLSFLS